MSAVIGLPYPPPPPLDAAGLDEDKTGGPFFGASSSAFFSGFFPMFGGFRAGSASSNPASKTIASSLGFALKSVITTSSLSKVIGFGYSGFGFAPKSFLARLGFFFASSTFSAFRLASSFLCDLSYFEGLTSAFA
jgi:hypothetical protein